MIWSIRSIDINDYNDITDSWSFSKYQSSHEYLQERTGG
jgi:hypothetical protein